MKIQELKTMSEVELDKLLKKNREMLRDMRFRVASGQLNTVREIRRVRRENARIMTVLAQNTKTESK